MTDINATNVVDYIMDFEDGSIDKGNLINLFQYLLDSGMAWQLQGTYGRMTQALLNEGYLIKR